VLLFALLATVRLPVYVCAAVGANFTDAVHEAPAAREVPQVFVSENGAAADTEEIVAVAVPVLEIVTDCVAVVEPSASLPNATEVGDAASCGPAAEIVTDCTISGTLELATLSRRSAPPFSASENCAPVSCTVAVVHVPVPGLVTTGPF
jgi:hypothetical protein